MSSQFLKLLSLSSLGLSLFLGNLPAFAQVDNSGSVVVPTIPSGSSTPTDRPIPTNTSTNIPISTTADGASRFTCQSYNGQYTIMYQPQSQPGQYFPWAAPAALGNGWNSQLRCQTIASRLESYRQDGLQELQTSVENRQNTVCVTTEGNPSCRIVLTVPPGKDPYTVRNSVFQNLTSADNGEQTTAVNTYTSSGRGGADELYNLSRTILGSGNNQVRSSKGGINLKPFLDRKDGGTASNLRNGIAIRRQSQPQVRTRLNPRNFR
jgi:Circadian oscillating protein COP23